MNDMQRRKSFLIFIAECKNKEELLDFIDEYFKKNELANLIHPKKIETKKGDNLILPRKKITQIS